MEGVAVGGAFVVALIFGLRYLSRPPRDLAPNRNKGWWTRENTAKSDAALGGCLLYSVVVLIVAWVALLFILGGGVALYDRIF